MSYHSESFCAEYHITECPYTERHYPECHTILSVCYAKCLITERHYAECHYAECRKAESQNAECRYAELSLC